MQKIFMLSFANIRKTKSHTFSLILMFMILAILLNLGLLVTMNFGTFFDKTAAELHTSDIYYIMPSKLYTAEVDRYLEKSKNITAMERVEAFAVSSEVKYGSSNRGIPFLMTNADVPHSISKWKTIDGAEPLDANLDEMPVYLPNTFALNGGYKINDKLTVKNGNKSVTFTIKGFTEDIYFSSIDMGLMSVYMPQAVYEKAFTELSPEDHTTVVFANLKKIDKSVETGIREINHGAAISTTTDISKCLFSFDLSVVKLSRTMMASVTSAITVAFSIIIALVCLIIVRFRISNSIEEDMTKIGSLKATGYTSWQIMLTIIVQYGIIALAGSLLGIVISYQFIPTISNVFAVQTGLSWIQGFDCPISSFVLLFILLVVTAVAFFAARRVRKINPIVALRGGIVTHSFRKNHMPLNKSRGNLPLTLGIKSNLQNMKQSLMIIIIMVAVGFSGTFGVVMFYNTVVDTSTFAETPGLELSNAAVVFNPKYDNSQIISAIKNMPHVQKVQYVDTDSVKVNNNDTSVTVMQDYSSKKTKTVYEGRYPRHANEIVLASSLAKLLDKKIGDNVTLVYGNNQYDFIITGFSQGSEMGGLNASITLNGVRQLNPNFKQKILQIYLDKGTDAAVFTDTLQKEYGDKVISVINGDKGLEQGMGPYVAIVSKIGIGTMAITIIVVLLVLYFVIVSSIIRKRRELGIQKAIGFTTLQLMNQLSISFVFPILIGITLGCILGINQTNPIMSVAQRSMGIMKANYIIRPAWIAVFGTATLIVSYIISMLITWRIRKISAYALVSE